MKILILIPLLIALSSCATVKPTAVSHKLSAWQGENINALIQIWGLPTNEKEINGIKYVEWNTLNVKRGPAVSVGLGGFGGNIFGSIGTTIFGKNKELYCRVQASYGSDGIITSLSWDGDAKLCNKSIPEKPQ